MGIETGKSKNYGEPRNEKPTTKMEGTGPQEIKPLLSVPHKEIKNDKPAEKTIVSSGELKEGKREVTRAETRFIPESDRLIPADFSGPKEPKQIKALTERPDHYPERFPIAPGTTWETLDAENYHPVDYTSPDILAGKWNAGPEDPHKVEGYPHFESFEGTVQIDERNGRPLNTMGATGLEGRGEESGWGRRLSIDGMVTWVAPDGKLKMIAAKRAKHDGGQWAIPGGGVEKGEDLIEATARELSEETGANLSFKDATVVYQGGVDDRRNTDKVWRETQVSHLHLEGDTSQITFRTQAGETTDVGWRTLNEKNVTNMYASHPDFVRLGVKDFEEKTGLVVDKEGNVGRPARVDVDRLTRDHNVTPEVFDAIDKNIDWPDIVVIPTGTDFKPNLSAEVFGILGGDRVIFVEKGDGRSGVSEQPLGAETIIGAENRFNGSITALETQQANPETADPRFQDKKIGAASIENGLFKGTIQDGKLTLDMSQEYDPNATYYDAAVVILQLPDGRKITSISPASDAVPFPKKDVEEAHRRGFDKITVGSVIQERVRKQGESIDNQDPHSYLTKERSEAEGGPFSRYQQLAGVITDAFVELSKPKATPKED